MAVTRPCGTYDESYAQDMAIVRTRLQWILLIGFLVILFTCPAWLGGEWVNLLNLIGISLIAVLGLNILNRLLRPDFARAGRLYGSGRLYYPAYSPPNSAGHSGRPFPAPL